MNKIENERVKGLPKGFRFKKLFYNPSSKLLVAQVEYNNGLRLYYRSINEARYQQLLKNEEKKFSFISVISATSSANIYCSVVEQQETKEGGGNWIGVYRIDLITKRGKKIFGHKDLGSENSERRAWLVQLLSLSANEKCLYFTAGFERNTNKFESVVDYYLCCLNILSRKITKLSPLAGIFL